MEGKRGKGKAVVGLILNPLCIQFKIHLMGIKEKRK